MSIGSFFWIITFLLFIILAYVGFTGEAEAEIIYITEVWMLNPNPEGLKWKIATLYLVENRNETPCGTVGCYRHIDHTMWIVNGSEGNGGGHGYGCSVLYHEILHGMGYADWYIKYHYPNWSCSANR
jgi:hypothetical protein